MQCILTTFTWRFRYDFLRQLKQRSQSEWAVMWFIKRERERTLYQYNNSKWPQNATLRQTNILHLITNPCLQRLELENVRRGMELWWGEMPLQCKKIHFSQDLFWLPPAAGVCYFAELRLRLSKLLRIKLLQWVCVSACLIYFIPERSTINQ